MTAQGLGHGLQHKVIDREGMALLLQLFAEGQQGGDVHLHRLGDGGDLHSRGVHPLGHHLPHAGELLHRVALHQLQVLHREGGAGDSRRRGDLPISRGGSSCLGRGLRRSQDVPLDDPAAGAGAGEDGVVHAHLSGDLPGQGRDSDPLAPGRRGCRRGRSQRSRRLRRRGSRSRGYSGGSSLPHLFAGLADVGQQSLHRYILALLGHDLQQDAVLLAGDLIGELISGDLHHHVPGLYSVSLVLDPLGDGSLLHGQAQLGHQYFISHLTRLLTCSARA